MQVKNHVPVAVSKEPCVSGVPVQASGDRLQIPGLSGQPSDSENVVVEKFVVEPKDEIRASQMAGTMFLHIFLKIRFVKFVSSH